MRQFGVKAPGATYTDRPGAYAVIQDERGLFALIRLPHGCFLPGGGIDPGESPESALAREVNEETGLSVCIHKPIGEAAQYLDSSGAMSFLNKIGHFFSASFGPRIGPPLERDHDLIWVSKEEALRLLKHEYQAWALGLVP